MRKKGFENKFLIKEREDPLLILKGLRNFRYFQHSRLKLLQAPKSLKREKAARYAALAGDALPLKFSRSFLCLQNNEMLAMISKFKHNLVWHFM